MAEQGGVEGFFTNTKNADMLSDLVGDIHNAIMDYQVCGQSKLIVLMPDIHSRLHYNKISIKRVPCSL